MFRDSSGIVRARKGRCNACHGHQISRGHLGGQIRGAKIGALGVREAAKRAAREADRAEVYGVVGPDGGLRLARTAAAKHFVALTDGV
jgi:hypothetical protein